MTEPAPLQQVRPTFVRFRGRKLSYFSGCDYFRLASHPKVLEAVRRGLKDYGLNVAASRLTTGNHELYRDLEACIADFFDCSAAALVSNGYSTNLVAAQALAGSFSHALVDELSHPSLADAARFLDCKIIRFKHRNPDNLARRLGRCGRGVKPIVLTDGMFARDGSAAPLAEYLEVLPKNGLILVDDAHAAGVLGRTGKGTMEHAGVDRRRVVQTITLSKAFGAFGGAVLGASDFRQQILKRSRPFIGSTPLPLPLAAAAIAGINLLKNDRSFRARLVRNTAYVRQAMAAVQRPGTSVAVRVLDKRFDKVYREFSPAAREAPGPIVVLPPQSPARAAALSRALLKAGILPPLTKYLGSPRNGLFRFVISSEHTREQLDQLIEVLRASF